MSGPVRRRPQKHQNTKAFNPSNNKNSKKTKQILQAPNAGLCQKCTDKVEWKKQYRKYKPLTGPKKCPKCGEKRVKYAYHVWCETCASGAGVCAWCREAPPARPFQGPQQSEQQRLIQLFDGMPERQRRTILRRLDRGEDLDDILAGNAADGSESGSGTESGSESEDSEDQTLSKTESLASPDLSRSSTTSNSAKAIAGSNQSPASAKQRLGKAKEAKAKASDESAGSSDSEDALEFEDSLLPGNHPVLASSTAKPPAEASGSSTEEEDDSDGAESFDSDSHLDHSDLDHPDGEKKKEEGKVRDPREKIMGAEVSATLEAAQAEARAKLNALHAQAAASLSNAPK